MKHIKESLGILQFISVDSLFKDFMICFVSGLVFL